MEGNGERSEVSKTRAAHLSVKRNLYVEMQSSQVIHSDCWAAVVSGSLTLGRIVVPETFVGASPTLLYTPLAIQSSLYSAVSFLF